jgi:chitodextrinase
MSLTEKHQYSVSGARVALALALLGLILGAGLAPAPVAAGSDAPTVDFGIALMPSSLTIPQGTRGTTSVNLVPPTQIGGGSGGYTSPSSVALSISGLPSGVTASGLGNVTPTSTSATLLLSVSASAATGQFTVTVTGTAPGQTRTAQLTLTIAQAVANDFNIGVTSASLIIARGSGDYAWVSLSSSASLPSGPRLTISGLPAGVTGQVGPFGIAEDMEHAQFAFEVASTAAVGSTLVTITATAGDIVRTTTVYLQVVAFPLDFQLSGTSVSLAQGSVGPAYVRASAGPVTFAIAGLPAGVTASLDPVTGSATAINLSVSSTAPVGTTAVTVIGTSGPLIRTATLILTITAVDPTTDFDITTPWPTIDISRGHEMPGEIDLVSTGGFSGAVLLSVSGLPSDITAKVIQFPSSSSVTLVDFTASSATATGAHTVTVTGTSGGLSRSTTLTLNVRASEPFFLEPTPAYVRVTRGATAAVPITSGWTASNAPRTLTYSVTGLPSGVTASFNPESSSTGTTLTLSASSAAAIETSVLTVSATSADGDIATLGVRMTVDPPPASDFVLIASPTAVDVVQSSAATANVNLARIGGFTEDVSLSVSGLPSDVSASVTPFRASDSGSLATVTFSARNSAATSQYTVTITGTSASGVIRTTTLKLSVDAANTADFSLVPNQTSLQMIQGSTSHGGVQLVWINGSRSKVTLSVSGVPAGVTTTILPFEASDSGTAGMVNYQASGAAAIGVYSITITGTSASGVVRTATVSLEVTSGMELTPPSVPANPVWSADGMTVTLSWQPSTDDVAVVGYDLYYGSFFLGTFADPQLSLIGFKAGTQYVFTVKARDAAGNVSASSSPMTVLLSAPKDTTAPTAPTNLAATSVSSIRVSLSWTASKDDVGVVVYQVSVNGKISGTVTSPSATLTSLTPSTSYSVTVTALDAAGNVSQASTALTVKTTAS